ncbi:hypothetical protein BJ508DRAFT_410005 [Ascobolus immersus RN42]|uniref:Uncharacterized protein n=1 Tax=Ascobolus immersus RN42 TaxID=1160509 RepID=A0A3N4IRR4_ASCIM|nr:hypothetical protein BJ508DRAFT_410005 [Ascobolus immersus RN42]
MKLEARLTTSSLANIRSHSKRSRCSTEALVSLSMVGTMAVSLSTARQYIPPSAHHTRGISTRTTTSVLRRPSNARTTRHPQR